MLENTMVPPRGTVEVLVDGEIVGRVWQHAAEEFCETLRRLKISDAHPEVGDTTEIACLLPIESSVGKSIYPAVLIFTAFARMVRPVHHTASGQTEWVSPLTSRLLIPTKRAVWRVRYSSHRPLM
jgi:hypothetical protein